MRSFLINKNLSFYYWLKKRIGKKEAFLVANTIEKVILIFGREYMGERKMVAYKFYCCDEAGTQHFLGILPERRKNPERITEKSILNWGWEIIGDNSDVKNIYFVQLEMEGLKD